MSNKSRQQEIAEMILAGAERLSSEPDVPPSLARVQRDRLRAVVADNCIALDSLVHVFRDINTTSALDYFTSDEANMIRQAASSLSEARSVIRKLSDNEWLRKRLDSTPKETR